MSDPASRRFTCEACGRLHQGWVPRCIGCGKWGVTADPVEDAAPVTSVEPEVAPVPSGPRLVVTPEPIEASDTEDPAPGAPIPLSDVPETSFSRDRTGVEGFDEVLGGGLVVGSVIVLGGEPGIGKSSLLMQVLDGLRMNVFYVTGEESVAQAAMRARRIDAASPRVWIVAEVDLDMILAHARAVKADIIAIDSVQTVVCADLKGGAGSPNQVKECANRLMKFAKDADVSVFLVGHVTADGALAGPTTLRHLVDIVLDLSLGAGRGGSERILRCLGKNRFGPAGVIVRFEMTATGLIPFVPEEFEDDSLNT